MDKKKQIISNKMIIGWMIINLLWKEILIVQKKKWWSNKVKIRIQKIYYLI